MAEAYFRLVEGLTVAGCDIYVHGDNEQLAVDTLRRLAEDTKIVLI